MLLRVDPKVILSCITSLNALFSHSTDTKQVANGLRRPHGLFEVDGHRRNDFYLFPEAGGSPRAHLYQPFLISAKFDNSTTLSHAAVLCPERDTALCHLADLVSEHFGLGGMVAVLLQVIHEGGGHTLSPHHDRPDWSAVVSVTLSGKATFVLEKTSQLHVSNGDAWCLCDSGRHCFDYNTQHRHHKFKASRTAVVLRFQCPPPF